MLNLCAGKMGFHNHKPVELLYRILQGKKTEIWMVKDLFAEPLEHSVTFKPTDTFTYFHGAKGWNLKAKGAA